MRGNHATENNQNFVAVASRNVVALPKFAKMRVAVVCVLLSLAALAYSQRPQPCVAPSQWSGRFFQRDRNRRFEDRGILFYDAQNLRIASIFEVQTSQGRDTFYDLEIYDKTGGGVRYTEDRNTRECKATKTTDSFRPIHIPENATFVEEFYLGASGVPDAGVLVQQWVGNTTNPTGEYSILVTVTGCVPINDFFYDVERDDVFETFFYDVVPGILDPNVFIPPDNCPQP